MSVDQETLRAALKPNGTLGELDRKFEALGNHYSGKVRENFSRNGERIIVVTDRVSAFDVVLGTIPFKGQVLNAMAQHWFRVTEDLFDNHLIDVPDPQATRAIECEPIPVEVVVRGYLTGTTSTSIWKAYERGDRTFCGHALPEGMRKHQRLEHNIVTPSTKAAKGGHDQSVSKDELYARKLVEPELFEKIEQQALRLFEFGQKKAAERGLLLVDTKYELGRAPDGRVLLIDEIHTPDSSRYWYAEPYEAAMREGHDPKALDKEYVRRWLVSVGFSGDGVPPKLTDELRLEAAQRYIELYERVTGEAFVPDTQPPQPRLAHNLGLGAIS